MIDRPGRVAYEPLHKGRAASRLVRLPELPKAKMGAHGFYPRMSRCYSFARAAVSGAVTKKTPTKGGTEVP